MSSLLSSLAACVCAADCVECGDGMLDWLPNACCWTYVFPKYVAVNTRESEKVNGPGNDDSGFPGATYDFQS